MEFNWIILILYTFVPSIPLSLINSFHSFWNHIKWCSPTLMKYHESYYFLPLFVASNRMTLISSNLFKIHYALPIPLWMMYQWNYIGSFAITIDYIGSFVKLSMISIGIPFVALLVPLAVTIDFMLYKCYSIGQWPPSSYHWLQFQWLHAAQMLSNWFPLTDHWFCQWNCNGSNLCLMYQLFWVFLLFFPSLFKYYYITSDFCIIWQLLNIAFLKGQF